MSKSIVALPISAVFDIIIVMMASLVPLAIASRISPMQAIRNINNTRKVKTKKIKSQKEFSVPNHLAKRNLQFYKGSRIAISVILVVTIVFSAFMFSYLSYAKNDIRSIPADYILESLSDTGGTYYNEASKGLTESERQDINDLPYVASTTGEKKASAMIEVDEINDFVRVINSERYEYSGDHAPTSVDEFASNVRYGDAEENYYNNLEFLNINSEVITTKIYGYDDEQLADLENASIDGKIDFDKLNSGEEVILVAPKKAELSANFGNSCWGYRVTYDENVGKYDAGYKSVLVADCPYKVGDEITIDVATVTYDENTDEINSTNVTQKTVKVGAIVSINDVDDNDE
jgi:cytoskeletal protein RodZ